MTNRLKEIFTRTCCRNFDTTKTISKDQLKLIMKAGRAAPSAKNRQPYYFIAILNKNCRKEIADAAQEARKKQFAHLSEEDFDKTNIGDTGSNDKSIYEASAAILVFRDSDREYSEADTESEKLNIKEEQGVAVATYSMMLQAEHMGISSGWICSPLYIKDELKNILIKYNINFNNNWEPRAIITLGYCSIKPKKPQRIQLKEKSCIVE